MKTLLVFGDSWAYGSELDDNLREQQCFGRQLANLLGIDTMYNFAETGSSISHLHLQLQQAISSTESATTNTQTAVFFLTGQQRFLAFDPDNEFYNLINTGPSIRPIQQKHHELINTVNQFYYKYIQSHTADHLSLNANLISLQARCKYHGIDDYYISGWQELDLWPEVDKSRIYPTHCMEIFGTGQYIKPNISHPNAQGHRLIAEKLFEFVSTSNTL